MADVEVAPALTPEEWAHAKEWTPPSIHCDASGYIYGGAESVLHHDQTPNPILLDERPHALAALALYDQLFGFTAEDVEWLRCLAGNHTIDFNELPRWAESLRARIAALLPPEGA